MIRGDRGVVEMIGGGCAIITTESWIGCWLVAFFHTKCYLQLGVKTSTAAAAATATDRTH